MICRLEGEKIIDATEMARAENDAIDDGYNPEKFMLQAAKSFADLVEDYIIEHRLPREVTFFCGKGNNGADGFATAILLIEKGFAVKAFYLYDFLESSLLNRKFFKILSQKIEIQKYENQLEFSFVIIDALVGTGFKDKPDEKLTKAIEAINQSSSKKIALDIPSGLDGSKGATQPVIVKADTTLYLEVCKTGFFINKGLDYVNELRKGTFSFPAKYLERALGFGFVFNQDSVKNLLPPMMTTQHKYERGYVLAVAGSKGMGGAALLSTLSCMRSGAGIVRLLYQKEMENELQDSFLELIKTPLSKEILDQEGKRASAILIGPGLGHNQQIQKEMLDFLENFENPCVIDADMLTFFAEHGKKYPKEIVLTPHRFELIRLLGAKKDICDEDLLEIAQGFVEEKKVTLVLKGAPTFILSPKKPLLVFYFGDKGMATAGSGDVLAGIIAGLLSRKMHAREAAAVGVYIHQKAGKAAAMLKGSHSVIASDIIEELPALFHFYTS